MSSDYTGASAAYKSKESGYRDKALKLYPWVCGNCAREFVYSNLRELTVHHKDHDHTNNPEDGSNWELLCLYCHDHEHSKYTDHDRYGVDAQAKLDDHESATHNPFADLAKLMKK
ncbi:YajD family HNH nuclease [Vibrio lamellibrachiae]|uniref:YajD family HNH nuclease n=1 Tax=Vibrio lamellibrachiae TaxID=2910253 RepID=UPI003D0B6829